MPDRQPIPGEHEHAADATVLAVLLHGSAAGPWTVDELHRELGHDVTDSLNRLYGSGLVHRLDRFVWASRAAVAAEEIGS